MPRQSRQYTTQELQSMIGRGIAAAPRFPDWTITRTFTLDPDGEEIEVRTPRVEARVPRVERPQPVHPDWINLLLGLVFALAFAGQFPRAVPWAQAILLVPMVGVLWRQWQVTRPLPPKPSAPEWSDFGE